MGWDWICLSIWSSAWGWILLTTKNNPGLRVPSHLLARNLFMKHRSVDLCPLENRSFLFLSFFLFLRFILFCWWLKTYCSPVVLSSKLFSPPQRSCLLGS